MTDLTKNKKGIIEMLALIKSGKLTIVRNEHGQIQSLNCNKPDMQVKDIRYSKNVMGGMVVGSTLEELEEDEQALREFVRDWSYCDVMHLAKVAELLNSDNLSDEDVDYLNRELQYYVERNKEVVVKEVKVPVKASETPKRGKYPDLFENLNTLDSETLKAIKRQATRNGADDLKNACRTILRHRGECC